MKRIVLVVCLWLFAAPVCLASDPAREKSVEELRSAIGKWNVVTKFLNPDGSVAKTVEGTYEFSWVIQDQVVSGRADNPAINQTSAILFYINEGKKLIEMVSVGGDGHLWIMNGPFGENQRFSQVYETQDGGTGQLRFTRFNAEPHRFESKMEYTSDGGKTWIPGNHQVFLRDGTPE